MSNRSAPLARGVWGVLATPFVGDDHAVDVDSLQRQVALYSEIGAMGVVALGVFGESSKLSEAERCSVLRAVMDAAGETPVAVGLSSLATAPAMAEAEACLEAAGVGVQALMVQACSSEVDVLVDHLQRLHAATDSDIIIQNYPTASGIRVTSGAIVATVKACDFVVAVKAESPPTAVDIAQITARTDVSVFGGLGGVGLIDEMAAGSAGAMTGFSHPEALVASVEAFSRGGFAEASATMAPWLPLANFEGQPEIGLAIRKQMLCERGIIADPGIRAPGSPLPPELRPMVANHMVRARSLLEKP